MTNLHLHTTSDVKPVFDNYPGEIRPKIQNLRRLILETANDAEEVQSLKETLKWGEPSYIAKYGSTIRIDWKPKSPTQYAMYFQCTSRLVPTFKAIFGDTFEFEGNRAIIFQLNEEIPESALKHCIKAGLTYHKVKHLPLLGM